jgi:hypothetical protein
VSDLFFHIGVGLNTENGYYYKQNSAESENGDPPFIVDTNVEDAENNIIHGVQVSPEFFLFYFTIMLIYC